MCNTARCCVEFIKVIKKDAFIFRQPICNSKSYSLISCVFFHGSITFFTTVDVSLAGLVLSILGGGCYLCKLCPECAPYTVHCKHAAVRSPRRFKTSLNVPVVPPVDQLGRGTVFYLNEHRRKKKISEKIMNRNKVAVRNQKRF